MTPIDKEVVQRKLAIIQAVGNVERRSAKRALFKEFTSL
jgi:hypothetical protein